MSKRDDLIWKAIQTICWLLFAGFCIQTGTLLFNYIYSLFKPIATHNLHLGLDLSELYTASKVVYSLTFVVIITLSGLKAYLLYLALSLFKTLNLSKPFSSDIQAIIAKITYYTFTIGIVSIIAQQHIRKLRAEGFNTGLVMRYMNDGGAYLVMAAILFVIALIFRRGIDLQNENDLTV